MATFVVALLGGWPDEEEWRMDLEGEVAELLREKCGDGVTINFIEPTPTSMVSFFPHGSGSVIVEDLVLAQQSMLAHKADLVVYIDDRLTSEWKSRLWDRLDDQAGAMLVWIPVMSEERQQDLAEEAGCKPGIVVCTGPPARLAAMIAFICLQGETDL